MTVVIFEARALFLSDFGFFVMPYLAESTLGRSSFFDSPFLSSSFLFSFVAIKLSFFVELMICALIVGSSWCFFPMFFISIFSSLIFCFGIPTASVVFFSFDYFAYSWVTYVALPVEFAYFNSIYFEEAFAFGGSSWDTVETYMSLLAWISSFCFDSDFFSTRALTGSTFYLLSFFRYFPITFLTTFFFLINCFFFYKALAFDLA